MPENRRPHAHVGGAELDRCGEIGAAILAVSAKCGAGASLTGGMHISPEIGRPYFSRQLAMKASASDGATPAFCCSSPVLS